MSVLTSPILNINYKEHLFELAFNCCQHFISGPMQGAASDV